MISTNHRWQNTMHTCWRKLRRWGCGAEIRHLPQRLGTQACSSSCSTELPVSPENLMWNASGVEAASPHDLSYGASCDASKPPHEHLVWFIANFGLLANYGLFKNVSLFCIVVLILLFTLLPLATSLSVFCLCLLRFCSNWLSIQNGHGLNHQTAGQHSPLQDVKTWMKKIFFCVDVCYFAHVMIDESILYHRKKNL